jgi:prepilin-type N-terminal cleavage/methylation domain-containing protein
VGRRFAAQDGFTMIEVLLAMMLGLMIVAVGAIMFTTVLRSQTGLSARDQAIRQGRITMERLTREVRQGEGLDTAAGDSWSSQSLSFRTFVHSASCADPTRACVRRVTYTCTTAGTCNRVEADPNTGVQGSPVLVVSGLASSAVFDYRADPTTECSAPPAVSNEAVSIRDEATLRNSGPESPSRVCVSLVFPRH